jgi:hypothetical protein
VSTLVPSWIRVQRPLPTTQKRAVRGRPCDATAEWSLMNTLSIRGVQPQPQIQQLDRPELLG